VTNYVNRYAPDEVLTLANTGRAFVFNSPNPDSGPTVIFRAEMDALPIQEISTLRYRSARKGIAHVCGHDGHTSIVAGLASKLAAKRPEKGRVVLLFQPAEETGQGAKDMIADPAFEKIKPDFAYALHNIPGEEKHSILFREGSFAAASRGLTAYFFGKTSHAAEPENGINPSMAISRIILAIEDLIKKGDFESLTLATTVNVNIGEIAFGTSAGQGELRMTLRAFLSQDMKKLISEVESIIQNISREYKIRNEFDYSEVFPVTKSSESCTNVIKTAIDINSLNYKELKEPYKWSEDFGYFSKICDTGFFGLGSGIDQPALHNPDFDFPEEIIETGIQMFYAICRHHNYKS
jgi:amidohydrolase